MQDYVSPLLQWLNANPEWAGLVTFLISAAESVAIIGTIVPGSITMTAIGALAGAGVIPLWQTLFWATLGAIVGDGISYWIGHYFNDRLRRIWPFKNNPSLLGKGEIFVHKYGVMSVFIGRFVGPVRALVPLVAGMLGMKPLQFTVANVTSAIGWAPAYMLPGILLGAASLELPPDIAFHVMLVLLLLVLFALLCLWIIYKLFQLVNKQTDQFLNHIWNALKKSRHFHMATVLLKHHDSKQHHGQLTLLFYFLLTSILFLALITYVKIAGPQHLLVNEAVFHFFRGIRTDSLDNMMIGITLLGQKEIVLPMVLAIFCWFLATKRLRAALHTLALGILAGGSVFVIKNLVQTTRPWGIFNSPETFSMPSGHVTLATTVYMGIAFIIATPMVRFRKLIYIPAALVTLVVGISRLYLGAHWFTDVLAAWLLSAALLIIVILSFNRQYEKPISLLSITIVAFSTLFVCYAFYYEHHFATLKINYTQINWPTISISQKDWWEADKSLPASRVSLFGFPSQNINIQWAGNLEEIKETLMKDGWKKPPARDWISTLHRVSGIESAAYLPLVSPQYLDKKPVLILAKHPNGARKLLVIRLWESNRIIQETQTPLWVGTVDVVHRSYSWLFRKSRQETDINPDLLLQIKTGLIWQWKTVTVSLPVPAKKQIEQHILLIKKNK
ncbi:MAG: VTT domain-containing protein [Gammaproteobacteria bacterium]|nr:VTT domain-containing protein [Gammaproteobacteria bacterium]